MGERLLALYGAEQARGGSQMAYTALSADVGTVPRPGCRHAVTPASQQSTLLLRQPPQGRLCRAALRACLCHLLCRTAARNGRGGRCVGGREQEREQEQD